jgi:hypothetical protein
LPLVVSQMKPAAHCVESAHWPRHAPNAGSQRYGVQSNAVVATGQVEAAPPEQYDAAMPSVGLVHFAGAHWLPPLVGTQTPPTPHVAAQFPGLPQLPRGSVPTGTTVHFPGAVGSAHE